VSEARHAAGAGRRPSFFHHLHPPRIPAREARLTYTFGLGGISLLLFLVVLVTGILKMFYYIPSIEEANRSVQTITLMVPYGSVVRGLHFWAAQGLVATAVLHLLRVVLSGGYKGGRRFNWLLGLGLLVLVLLFDFTGYALRWDAEIAWALMVGTNLLKSIPWIGEGLYGMVVGGQAIGSSTVVRLYGWHVYGLLLAGLVLLSWHLFRVRRDGGISRAERRGPTISRDDLVWREGVAVLIVLIVLLLTALFLVPSVGAPADFAHLPAEAQAPWFFLWVQELLRHGPPLLMGVAVPLALLVLLALLPYALDRSDKGEGVWFNRPGRRAQAAALLTLALVLGLTLLGLQR
jgi:quinol-cytochrome oxidoreductase complex cytochrome b subunit